MKEALSFIDRAGFALLDGGYHLGLLTFRDAQRSDRG